MADFRRFWPQALVRHALTAMGLIALCASAHAADYTGPIFEVAKNVVRSLRPRATDRVDAAS